MSTPGTKGELLPNIFNAVGETLLKKIKSEDVTAADIANAIKFLKDNGITADPEENPHLKALTASLPTTFENEIGGDVIPIKKGNTK